MFLLIVYISCALGFSFLCSIFEAVMLSANLPYIVALEKDGKKAGRLLRGFKQDINEPLAAILTLNTIAHTVGAAGAGAQAALVFGNAYVGVISAVLTLLILIFSEIIPKTLGAHYWRALAPITAYSLKGLIILLYPFVWMAKGLTKNLTDEPTLNGFSREEFSAIAELGEQEGQLDAREMHIIRNLFRLGELPIKAIMTPRPVIFALPQHLTVETFTNEHEHEPFSRILLYEQNPDKVTGFALRSDLILAHAQGNSEQRLKQHLRELPAISSSISVLRAFDELLNFDSHILLVVNEYGVIEGLVTQEDVFETLLGIEITDEVDKTTDMQKLARRFGRLKARSLGLPSGKQDKPEEK
jgi:CBS domain containing-hemolysin-like protein